ncbi:pathogenesis-related thaumatin superfamily protein [Actinidia rufa]|uniref:Pathogenesis-related thaumatin superfamily protein n=1 Tax=Actinidia rufa TaxID=165716 RepID=A0A7J0FPP9_9ERIC|nr:pathogenesis-related thaumatin superfamily protein [Actinidia rufa]
MDRFPFFASSILTLLLSLSSLSGQCSPPASRAASPVPSRRPIPGRVGSGPGPSDPKTQPGNSPAPPPTAAPARSSAPAPLDEFTLNGDQGLEFYDELGRRVQPPDDGGGEGVPGMSRVKERAKRLGTRSIGVAKSIGRRRPEYSQFFKHVCPRSYSYAYDDQTSPFTCASTDYTMIFCPQALHQVKRFSL